MGTQLTLTNNGGSGGGGGGGGGGGAALLSNEQRLNTVYFVATSDFVVRLFGHLVARVELAESLAAGDVQHAHAVLVR
jgi:hypothetical protein